MKGSQTARNQQRSAQRNYQLSSLVSISNVKSIIASMNGSESSGVVHNKPAAISAAAPVSNLSPSGSNKRSTSFEEDVVRAERKKRPARKNSCDAPKSISAADNESKADEMLETRNNSSMSAKSAVIPIVNATNERRPGPSSLDSDVSGDGGKNVVEHNGNVMTSDSRNNKVDQRVKLKSAKKGHGHSPSSSSDDNDDEDESEISSAEDSSDELETSSSNDSDHRRNGSSGGLEPISEERSLRIDLPDLSRGDDDRNRDMARLVVGDDEDDANNDGNVTIVIL